MFRKLAKTEKPASFHKLIKAADLNFVEDTFERWYNYYWTDKGDRVRGELILVDIGGDYTEFELLPALARESDRLGRTLRAATAYELAYYASHGWNGIERVVAFGSSFRDLKPNCARCVATLRSPDGHRGLSAYVANITRPRLDLVLCVVE